MVAFFRESSLTSIITVVITCVLVHLRLFFHPAELMLNEEFGLINNSLKWFANWPSDALSVLYVALVLLTAFRLNHITLQLKMQPRQGFATAMSYVLLSAIFVSWGNIIPALFMNFFLCWLFLKTGKSYNTNKPNIMVYNIGLLCGSVVLLYHPLLILILFIIVAIAIVRPFRINEWFIVLAGIFTPYYFLGVYLFLTDKLDTLRAHLPTLDLHWPLYTTKTELNINLIVVAIIIFGGIYYWQQGLGKMLIQARKMWYIFFLLLVVLLPVSYFYQGNHIEASFLLLLPLSPFFANLFNYPRQSLLPGFIFWMMIAIIAINQYGFFNWNANP